MFDFAAPIFWYKLVFMGELVFAEILATYTLKKKDKFFLRASVCLVGVFAIAFVFPVFYNSIYASAMFFCFFGVTLAALKICYDEQWVNIVFCGIIAYNTQHISYQTYSLLVKAFNLQATDVYSYTGEMGGNVFANVVYFGVYALTYWLIWAFVEYRIRVQEDLKINNKSLLVLASTIVLTDIVLNSVMTYAKDETTSRLILSVFDISNIISCALAFGIQFYMLGNKLLQKELKTVQALWRQDKVNYELAKENIDIINIKCHDLKHQIAALRNSEGEVDKEILKGIENAVNIYGTNVKTGNDVLDVILTEKSLYCEKNNIKLTCLADGSQLSLMSPADIYSLFGNAVQNAIEAARNVDDRDKRLIRLKIVTVYDFLTIHLENFYDPAASAVVFENGLPLTTKSDKNYHGFGMRSMRLLVEKYGGQLTVEADGEIFNLNICIPLNNKTGKKNA